MKITLGDLRKIIKQAIVETGGGTTLPRMPMIRNAMQPDFSDREQIGKISTQNIEDPEELPPHLREPVYSPEETWGPVPPTAPNPYTLPDPYAKDSGPLPTPPIKR